MIVRCCGLLLLLLLLLLRRLSLYVMVINSVVAQLLSEAVCNCASLLYTAKLCDC